MGINTLFNRTRLWVVPPLRPSIFRSALGAPISLMGSALVPRECERGEGFAPLLSGYPPPPIPTLTTKIDSPAGYDVRKRSLEQRSEI